MAERGDPLPNKRRPRSLGRDCPPESKTPPALSEVVSQHKIAWIRAIGSAAGDAARDRLVGSEFHAILRSAVEAKILTIDKLSEIARVDRTSASRWVNGHNTPPSLTQETVLLRIEEAAFLLADDISKRN